MNRRVLAGMIGATLAAGLPGCSIFPPMAPEAISPSLAPLEPIQHSINRGLVDDQARTPVSQVATGPDRPRSLEPTRVEPIPPPAPSAVPDPQAHSIEPGTSTGTNTLEEFPGLPPEVGSGTGDSLPPLPPGFDPASGSLPTEVAPVPPTDTPPAPAPDAPPGPAAESAHELDPAAAMLPYDPALGANPDAVPVPEMASPAPAGTPSPSLSPMFESGPAPAPDMLPYDPALGENPDAVPAPEIALPPMPQERPAPELGPTADLAPIMEPFPATSAESRPATAAESVPAPDLSARSPSTAPADQEGQRHEIQPPDQELKLASATVESSTPLRSSRKLKTIDETVARVGDEDITMRDLSVAVQERIDKVPPNQRHELTTGVLDRLAFDTLEQLIDRRLILQEVHRTLKSDKAWDMLMQQIDKTWNEKELPALMKKHQVSHEYELKRKLSEERQSLEDIHTNFRESQAIGAFVGDKLRPRMKVGLPEMREYYYTHLARFDRPATVTWREVCIEVSKHNGDRAEALRKAETVLAGLLRGEDFARMAQTQGEGPQARDGGLWKTGPNDYAVPSVNSALASLPLGQISPILEGPTSFHIVRVEARRAAGPASFEEVQDEVLETLGDEKYRREMEAFLQKLRDRTVIRTFYEPTQPQVQ